MPAGVVGGDGAGGVGDVTGGVGVVAGGVGNAPPLKYVQSTFQLQSHICQIELKRVPTPQGVYVDGAPFVH